MPQQRLNPMRVLIVDDDTVTRRKWEYLLTRQAEGGPAGCAGKGLEGGPLYAGEIKVSTAADGVTAVDIVRRHQEAGEAFCVAFIDVLMPPGKDGVWTAKRIRELDPNVQLVIVTGGEEPSPESIARQILPAHRLFYFRKPLYAEEMHQLVLALSDKWRTERLLEASSSEMRHRLAHDADKLKAEIAERERAEQASRLSEIFLEAVNDGLFLIEPETGIIRESNSSVTSLYGYSREEARGLDIGVLSAGIPPYTEADAMNRLERIRREGAVLTEWLARHKDGHFFWVEINSKLFEWEGEELVLSYVRNIHARKEAEQELVRIREALDDCGAAVLIMDAQECPNYFNAAFGLLFGYTIDRADEVSAVQLFKRREDSQAIIEVVQNGGQWAGEITMLDKDQREFPASLRATPVLNDEYEIVGITFILNDVSERRELEAQLLQAQNMRAVGQLAAGVAHEINTPMQFIGDNTHYLYDSFKDLLKMLSAYKALLTALPELAPAVTEQLASVHALEEELDLEYLEKDIPNSIEETMDGISRVSAIVKAMRQFTHPGSGSKKSIDINQAVEDTVTVSRNEWRYVAEVELDLAEELPLLSCYPGDINQVLLNLVVNAAQAIGDVVGEGGEEKGLIRISTLLAEEAIEVHVSDTGGGIPPEAQERVFEPFFTTKEVGKGTGQGLAISHAVVVKKHQGNLYFKTAPGEGTTFIVRLPLETAE